MNYLAVIVVGLSSAALGALWYSEILFGKPWIRAVGWSEHELERLRKDKNMLASIALAALAAIIATAVLALLLERLSVQRPASGAVVGLLVWIGFVATSNLFGVVFEKRPTKSYWIYVAYQAVVLAASGAVLTAW